jgi:hypothetical protein
MLKDGRRSWIMETSLKNEFEVRFAFQQSKHKLNVEDVQQLVGFLYSWSQYIAREFYQYRIYVCAWPAFLDLNLVLPHFLPHTSSKS